MMIQPTAHGRSEWARLAQDAYRSGRNGLGHRFSVAAATPGEMPLARYDALQETYREWLLTGFDGVRCPRCGKYGADGHTLACDRGEEE